MKATVDDGDTVREESLHCNGVLFVNHERRPISLLFTSHLIGSRYAQQNISLPCDLLLVASSLNGAEPKPNKDAPLDATFLRARRDARFHARRPVKPKPTPDGKAVLFLRAQARAETDDSRIEVATGKNANC